MGSGDPKVTPKISKTKRVRKTPVNYFARDIVIYINDFH